MDCCGDCWVCGWVECTIFRVTFKSFFCDNCMIFCSGVMAFDLSGWVLATRLITGFVGGWLALGDIVVRWTILVWPATVRGDGVDEFERLRACAVVSKTNYYDSPIVHGNINGKLPRPLIWVMRVCPAVIPPGGSLFMRTIPLDVFSPFDRTRTWASDFWLFCKNAIGTKIWLWMPYWFSHIWMSHPRLIVRWCRNSSPKFSTWAFIVKPRTSLMISTHLKSYLANIGLNIDVGGNRAKGRRKQRRWFEGFAITSKWSLW